MTAPRPLPEDDPYALAVEAQAILTDLSQLVDELTAMLKVRTDDANG